MGQHCLSNLARRKTDIRNWLSKANKSFCVSLTECSLQGKPVLFQRAAHFF